MISNKNNKEGLLKLQIQLKQQKGMIADGYKTDARLSKEQNLSLQLLESIQRQMLPHHKYFDIIEITNFVQNYAQQFLASMNQRKNSELVKIENQQLVKTQKNQVNENNNNQYVQSCIARIMQTMRNIFIYYGKAKLTYEMINQYVYNRQLSLLSHHEKDQQYMETGEKRVRIDENLKLCIMPLKGKDADEYHKNTRIKQIVFRQNDEGREKESIYVVTRDYIKRLRIQPQLIGIAPDFDRKGDESHKCWYHYQQASIKPKKNTLSVIVGKKQRLALNTSQMKQLRASKATNLQEIVPSHMLNILKVNIGKNIIGIISLDLSFIVEPLNEENKCQQGYIGNIDRDIPPQIKYNQNLGQKQKYQEILLFTNFGDRQWLIVTQKYLYLYRLPLPGQNIMINNQNNLNKANSYQNNKLLLLCQRMPKGCLKAVALKKPFVALMMEQKIVLIIKIILNLQQIQPTHRKHSFQSNQNIQSNYFKITNKIYNDVQFKTICFHSRSNYLFLSDFGAYVVKIKFNEYYGDIEEEGVSHDDRDGQLLTKQSRNNAYYELHNSRSRQLFGSVIYEENQSNQSSFIDVEYLKRTVNRQTEHLSIYQKQTKSPHTSIIKNHTRQIITMMTTNKHYSTLITYQSQSYEKKTLNQMQGQMYREWGCNNKIKLWDIHHMTVYQTFRVSIQIGFFELRSNGLYAVTTEKGYLGFYPFSEDQKVIISQKQQEILDRSSKEIVEELYDDVMIENGSIYFANLISTFNKFNNKKIQTTTIYGISMLHFPKINQFQPIPTEVSSLALHKNLYVIQTSFGIECSNLHIYNKMGQKQQLMTFSNSQDVDLNTGKLKFQSYNQYFKNMKKIHHKQFNVILWNGEVFKLIGDNPEESLTVVWFEASKFGHVDGERIRNIRNIEISQKTLVIYSEQTLRIPKKSSTINSQKSRSNKKIKNNYYEQTSYSLILISTDTDRITYKLEKIDMRLKVLHLYSSLMITKQEAANSLYQVIRVLDVGVNGTPSDKILFTLRYIKQQSQKVNFSHLKREGLYQFDENHNMILQQSKQYIQRKSIILQQSKICISSNNKLVLILVFKVETNYLEQIKLKIIKSDIQFMIYCRNITNELLNKDYKINKGDVGKVKTKLSYQFHSHTGRTENIMGHKVLNFDSLNGISNYTQIDMSEICDAIKANNLIEQGIDLTSKIIKPRTISDNRISDLYRILSLRKDQTLFKFYELMANKNDIIANFSFKFLQFDEDSLNGTIAITNKSMCLLSFYNFQMHCQKSSNEKLAYESDSHTLQMKLDKIGVIRVKSQYELAQIQKDSIKKLGVADNSHIEILEWDGQYKKQIQKMWQNSYINIRNFVNQSKNKVEKDCSEAQFKQDSLQAYKIKKDNLKKLIENANQPKTQHKTLEQQRIEGFSKMFKKWSIAQSIEVQKAGVEVNKIQEINIINKYINRVLKSPEDTTERINKLIQSTKNIKDVSSKKININRYQPEEIQNKMANIYSTYEQAKQSSIKSYIYKKEVKKVAKPSYLSKDSQKISRSETNKSSSLQDEILKLTNITEKNTNDDKLSDSIRFTTLSKASVKSNILHKPSALQSDGLASKIKIKLEQIQENLQKIDKYSEKKLLELNPQQIKKTVLKSKTEMSTYEKEVSSPTKSKTIRFATDIAENNGSKIKSKSTNLFSLTSPVKNPFEHLKSERKMSSQNNKNSTRHETDFKKQGNQPTILPFSKKTNAKTETSQISQDALEQLKRSQILMKNLILPEIKSNKQKLMLKMKQKKSYIKAVNSHLFSNNLSEIRNGEQRKQIINRLYEYK